MAALSEVSYYTRLAIKWCVVLFVVVLLTPPIWRLGVKIYLTLRPPPPAAPTVRYGKLPKLEFPVPAEVYKPNIKLETISGTLPKITTVGKVYLVGINKSRILELDRIKTEAQYIGLTTEPVKIDEQTYEISNPTLPIKLTVNLLSNGFTYKYDWATDQSLLTAPSLPNNEQAVLEARAFFQSMGGLAQDLTNGSTKVTYLVATPAGMVQTVSLSEANFIKVDLFRADKDEMKIVTESGDASPVNITFSGTTDRAKRIIEANYYYSRILDDDFGTYGLKTVDAAWSELQQGGGYIAKKAGQEVTVRKVTLAYYESNNPQQFLQPVFVFEGDGGFVGYVAAVSPEYSSN